MAERPAHQPKLAALEARRLRQLSTAGQARIERHLLACEVCRETLLGMDRYAKLLAEVRAVPLPAIDWARASPALQLEAKRLIRRDRVRRWGAPLALAVAAVAALFFAQPSTPSPTKAVVRVAHNATLPAPNPLPLKAQVTAIVGEVVGIDASGKRVRLELDSIPSEGWVIETGAQSELHFGLEATAALIVSPGSRLTLTALRPTNVVLSLDRGQVVSHVRKRIEGANYEIEAAGHRVAVRGTRFAVELLAASLGVQVDEGTVAILEGNGALVAELHAPERWQQDREPRAGPVALPLHRPREAAAGSLHWPVLELPVWPHVIGWSVDGAEFSAAAALRMRVPAGDVVIDANLDDERHMRASMRIDALGGRFDPRALRLVGSQATLAGAPKTLDPAQAAAVIRAGEPALQRCYERAMRGQTAGFAGILRVRLRLDIDARGRVRRAELTADEVPALLSDCVRQLAQGWRFAAPGGSGITFEAPIAFRPVH